jgi:predicted metal-dependent phosphoesterase TrpH
VERSSRAGVTVIAVTDHDTVAAVTEVQSAAQAQGIEVVAGIEITAIEGGRDVHLLGYFIDPHDSDLAVFLSHQRAQRIARVEALGVRLAELGMPIDVEALLAHARQHGSRSVGRPQIARAMIAAGYVVDTRDAFDRWLATGRPAFVPRSGASPVDVIDIVHAAGGLASLAHPGQTQVDARIATYAEAGLDAIEVYHPDHGADAIERYRRIAMQQKLLVTGGSDFHGDEEHGCEPGAVTLPMDEWSRLRQAASHA